ncbi:hypothetical protein Tco_0940111 [Tanacetum coccineum]|uniref:Uncharacterized protein n=1 Tax=Tanacetum coccineum TaxID=301880 RepID=A0ABQ5DPP5_9ASTR
MQRTTNQARADNVPKGYTDHTSSGNSEKDVLSKIHKLKKGTVEKQKDGGSIQLVKNLKAAMMMMIDDVMMMMMDHSVTKPDWFKQPLRPPTPDLEMKQEIDHLTQEILVEPTYNLLKGTCTSSIELEYNMGGMCFKKIDIQRLIGNNPEGDRCPFDLTKPLPLKGRPGHLSVAAEYYFNNDLEFLKSSDPKKKYTTSIMKTKAARYEIVRIEYMNPLLWSTIKHGYDKDDEKGIKHWGEKRRFDSGGEKSFSVKNCMDHESTWKRFGERAYQQLYKFKEGNFVDLHLNDIEDMLLLDVQHKLLHLNDNDIVDFIVALRMFTRSLIIKRRVKDLQLGVESYQKKLNITAPLRPVLN